MIYILVLIAVLSNGTVIAFEKDALYTSLNDCFEAREITIQKWGRPIINYQVICVATDKKGRPA
jgi:hypothetical protein